MVGGGCVDHIGVRIRKARKNKRISAETVGKQMDKPISKQAFAKKERDGSFSYREVEEVAKIIGVDMQIFLPKKSIKNLPNSSPDQGPAA